MAPQIVLKDVEQVCMGVIGPSYHLVQDDLGLQR